MMNKLLLTFSLWFSVGISMLLAQEKTITGTVISEADNSPLPGVSIVVKGSTQGTISNIDGAYTINVPSPETTLVFTFVGMTPVERVVGNQSVIDITMNEDVTSLSEIVITGYGEQLKTDLTGNIAKISGDDIQNMPVTNFEETLQGRASGVFVEASNGKLGQGIKMRIRGSSSVTADNQPLFVIDGVPITSQNVGDPTEASTNPLSDINFNDVESIDILKDASAAAIYGSRAANGVVIITTKKGVRGKTKFNLNYQTGVSSPTNKREWLNAEQYVDYILEAAGNSDRIDGVPIDDPDSWTNYAIGRLENLSNGTDWRNGEVNTNWEDQIYNDNATNNRVDLSASGGSDKTQFYISGSYLDQEGILVGNELERISGRMNLDHQATDKFKFGMNMSLARTSNNRVSDDNAFSTPVQLIAQAPISQVKIDGEYNSNTLYYNGLLDLEGVSRSDVTFRNLTNFYAGYEIIPGLVARAEFGVDLLTQNQDRYYASYTDGGNGTNGYGTSRWTRVFNYNTKAYLNYDFTASEIHDFSVTAGIEFQQSNTDVTKVEGQEFPVDDLTKIASAADIAGATSTLNEFSFLSYFGRVNYKFNNKYLVTLSARVDGSSRFGENNKYGIFPAGSVGWIISEEGFLQDSEVLSFLKLRASYGITGNAQIGNYDHLGLYNAEGYSGEPGLQPTQIYNPDLTWEKTAQTDIGFDFGFFNDRLTGEIDYYYKKSTDLLLDVNVPGTSGYRTQTQNIGELENKGVELVLNGTILTGEFKWNSSFNIAFNRNKILDLGESDIIDDGSSRVMNVVKVGEPIGVFYGKEYAGVDPSNGDALYYLNTADDPRGTTNDFDAAEYITLGSPNPDFVGGFTNNFAYKNFDLNIFFQFVNGNKVHNVGGVFQFAGDWFDNQQIEEVNRWQNAGDATDVPEARLGYTNGGYGRSSRYLYDGSYIRLKNITLGYNVPSSTLNRVFLSSARIYVSTVNLLTFTDYPGWDPEVSADYLTSNSDGSANNVIQGTDFYSAPQAKTITFGVKLGF
ncbi:SusC/RagA family TonB-linked outer membrane protein [Chondrinema litorale]|uniref:SusC/RagA family TonB-linked outer membrane protein n=1 Tax=Chondrinema litorale TaxID=2994555 RepID=UPI002543D827|nr:TonB-dependent receptor [Chondrinema litorale]UZR95143.1 TonB-dependent receptor [Chondrinema litorale]